MKRNAFIIFNLLLILFLGVGCVGHPEQPSQQVATIPVESTEVSKELSTAAANNTKLPLTKTAHKSNMSKGDVIGSEHVSTDAPVTILAGNVTLLIDSGAVSNEVEISIVATTEDNSGRIPENLTNLTADGAVYRMLPDGQQFEKDITIAMRYDSTALPYGCTADDIYTFFYNEQRHMWQQVERDSVDKQKQIVYSRTNHFTDYINGVLKVPENSDAMAYTPTSIKDLKAADPMEGITLIAPPEANNHGTTNLTYPLTIPAGRRGMQPQLAISYNSAGGSGILGLGWSLPISEISVDTRRGVPWYSDTLESETYTLDGEVLVTAYTDSNHLLHLNKPAYSIPWKHRSNADTMRFYPRVEGSFRRIERIGTSTDSYHWIVTDKNGIKYYYGEVDSARLKDEYGNIAKWCLNRVSDTYGNEITYTYTTYIDTVPRSGNISRQIIIKCINYTAYNRPPAEQGRYNVRFIYAEEDKIDAVTSGRYGFLEADAALLDHIIIEHNNTPIKYYVFGYKYGAFGKTLLCNIAEVSPDVFLSQCADCTGSFKDGRHNFHLPNYEFCGDNKYFDTIDSIRSERENDPDDTNSYIYPDTIPFFDICISDTGDFYSDHNIYGDTLQTPVFSRDVYDRCTEMDSTCIHPAYTIHSFAYSEIPLQMFSPVKYIVNKDGTQDRILGPLFFANGTPGPIEGSGTRSWNLGGAVAAGFGWDTFMKSITLGGSYSYNSSKSEGLISLIDLNGDGFSDKIYKRNDRIYYRLRDNAKPTHFLEEKLIDGIKDFLHTTSTSNSWGIEGSLGADGAGVCFGVNWTNGECATTTYFSDMDGDGLPDLVCNGQVLYNRINEDHGGRVFIPVAPGVDYIVLSSCGFFDTVYLGEPIDEWVFSDFVDSAFCDTIYKDDSTIIGINCDYSIPRPYKPNLENVRFWHAPETGYIHITDSACMRPYTIDSGDGVRLIVQYMDRIIKSDTLQSNANTSFLDTVLFVKKGEDIYFRVLSKDTRTSDRLMWNPTIAYCAGSNDTTTSYDTNSVGQYKCIYSYDNDFLLSGLQKIKMPFDAKVHIEATAYDRSGHAPASPTTLEVLVNGNSVLTIHPISDNSQSDRIDTSLNKRDSVQVRIVAEGDINWSNIEARCRIYIIENNATDGDSLFECVDTLSYPDSTVYFFDYYPQIQKLVYKWDSDPNRIYMYENYSVANYSKYGTMYRHWGQFAYKAPANSNSDILNRDLLNTHDIESIQATGQPAYNGIVSGTNLNINPDDPETSATIGLLPAYNPLASSFFVMQPDFKHGCWSAYSDYAYIERGMLSNLPHPADGMTIAQIDSAIYESSTPIYTPWAMAVNKKSANNSFGVSGSVSAPVPVQTMSGNASITMSESRQLSDMMDLNGDGLPDVISEARVQYTQPCGGLSRKTGYIYSGTQYCEYSRDTIHGGAFSGTSIQMLAEPANSTRHTNKAIKGNVGANLGNTRGHGNSLTTWVDINGDGLPDKVYSDGHLLHYYLNVGYKLLPISTFSAGKARHSSSLGVSGGSSFGSSYEEVFSGVKYKNELNVSITAGLGLSSSSNATDIITIDLNGDGLPDRLIKYGHIYSIQFNNGNGYEASNAQLQVATMFDNYSYTTDLTGAITVGVTLGVIPLKIEANPKVGLSRSLSCTEGQWADMNGDGIPDYIWNDRGKIAVRYSRLGEANRLTQVTLPSGGQYQMTYTLNDDGPESNMQHYVMSSLTIKDNRMQTPDQRRTFKYNRRHYDRIEREDYGYGEVITIEDSASLTGYRRTTQKFHNKDYLFRGLCYSTLVDNGNPIDTLSAQCRDYRLFEIASGNLIADSKPGCYGDGFPAILSDSTIYYHDGHRQIISRLRFGYTRFGNIDSVYDDGALNDPDDDYIATTTYDSIGDYIVSSVVDELVYNGNTVYRHRSAVRDATTGDIRTLTFNNNANSNSVYDFRYDIYGNIDTVVYPMNHNGQRFFITYKYDGEIHSLPIETSNAYALTSQAQYDCRWQKPTWTKSVNDATAIYKYDSQGRLIFIHAPFEYDSPRSTIRYEYYNQYPHTDRYWDTCKYWARTLNDNNGSNYIATTTISDGLGRPRVVKKVADVNGQTKRIIGGWSEFDALGRKVREFLPDIEDTSSADSAFCHPLSTPYTLFSYDRLDRVTKTIYPDNTVTKNQYAFGDDADGILRMTTKVTDQNGNVSHVFSNVRENNTTTIDPCGATTVFRYDNIGQLTKTISPDGDSTVHVYDMLGRRTDRIHPSAGHTRWDYDAVGNMIEQTQNSGEGISYYYHYSRPIHIAYSDRPWNNVWYEYGAAGSGSQAGRIIRQQDASGVQAFHYDCMGNVDTNWHTYVMPNSPQTFTLKTAWKYDSWGRIDTIVYPDNEKVVYTYDHGGNLLQINGFKAGINPTAYIEKIYYDKFGQRTYQQDGNGVRTYYKYDTLNRRLTSMYDSSLTEGLLQKNHYAYDHVGNIISITDSGRHPRIQTFSYDDCYRISSSDGTWINHDTLNYAASYQYSDAGRLNYKEVISERINNNGIYPVNYKNHYSYTSPDNPFAVESIHDDLDNAHEFIWDANGNLLTSHSQHPDLQRNLCWTEDNRLQGYTEYSEETGGMSAWYNYTANGERNLKLTSPQLRMRQNAINNRHTPTLIFPTLYTSPLVTLNRSGYTKHYFEGANRICSKIGGGFGNVNQAITESRVLEIGEDYTQMHEDQIESVHRTFEDCIEVNAEIIEEVDLHDVLMREHARGSEPEPAFYYHSDHLGSAAYLTDDLGQITQTLNYLPYGEDWVDIRNNLDPRLGQYTFNGKEKDYESGFHYYGARYYWSEVLTGWLSVDPMADKYPSISPYNYCMWNPIKLVDPDGRDGRVIIHNERGQKTLTIQTTIYLTTDSPKDFNRNKLNSLAKNYNYWAKQELKPKTLNGVTVQFDVTYKVLDKSTKLMQGDNIMSLNPNTPGRSGTPCKNKTNEIGSLMEQTTGSFSNINKDDLFPGCYKGVLHETGHLLGLSDRYFGYNTSFEGFEKDLMGGTPGFSSGLDETHYQNYIDYFKNQNMGTAPYILLDKKIDVKYTNKLINHTNNPAPAIQ